MCAQLPIGILGEKMLEQPLLAPTPPCPHPCPPPKVNGILRKLWQQWASWPGMGRGKRSGWGTSSERPLLQFRLAVAACVDQGRGGNGKEEANTKEWLSWGRVERGLGEL